MRALTSLAIAVALCTPVAAHADDAPPPTKEQLDAAKKAFEEADALYKAGKLPESIEKLKEAWRLSRNVFITYNIGHAYDQAGDKPKALAFYLKFIENAPADAPRIADATKRVDELQKQNVNPDLAATEIPTGDGKPTSKYSQANFKHRLIETVPPGKPIEIVASVPLDSGWSVTLFYRGPNDENYSQLALAPRASELVAEIPATLAVVGSLQYYIEVKDQAGTVITRSGRRTSPNLIKIEDTVAAVRPRTDDPLLRPPAEAKPPIQIVTPRNVVTAGAVVMLGATITTYLIAKQKGDDLRFDSTECGAPPCRAFDSFDQPLERDGKKYNTLYQVSLGVTIGVTGFAGYLWYRSLTKKKSDKLVLAPVFGDVTGLAAARPF